MKVAFTTGHGEPKPDDPGGKGLGNWKARLARVGCEVIDLNLVEDDDPRRPELADRGRARWTRSSRRRSPSSGPTPIAAGPSCSAAGQRAAPRASRSSSSRTTWRSARGSCIDPRFNYNGNWHMVARVVAERGRSPDLLGDGPRPLRAPAAAPRRSTSLGESARAGYAGGRAGGSEPGPRGDPADQPDLLGGDRPEEPPADPGPLDRRARAGDRRRGGRPPQGAEPAGRRRRRSSRGWSCSPAP